MRDEAAALLLAAAVASSVTVARVLLRRSALRRIFWRAGRVRCLVDGTARGGSRAAACSQRARWLYPPRWPCIRRGS